LHVPPEIAAEVRAVTDALAERGYRPVNERYDAGSFGNLLMVLERDAALVRLVRDRGQWFIEATPRGADDWFAPVVWHAALVAPIPPAETLSFDAQAQLLLGDLDQIEAASAVGESRLLEELRAVREARARTRREMPPG
jgi:hypothetical protein